MMNITRPRSEDLTRFPGDHVVVDKDGSVTYYDEFGTAADVEPYDGPRFTDAWDFWARQAGYANLAVAARSLGCTETQAAIRCGELHRARRQRVAS